MLLACAAVAADVAPPPANTRQSLDDAWWTGPIITAGAGTLPKGHFLIEPYVFDVVTYDRYDARGKRSGASQVDSFGSLTYILYGLTDKVTVGLIPTFGFNDVREGKDSSGIGVGDLTLQAQHRLTGFREGSRVPTSSLVLQHTLPTGKYDRLGERPTDGMGEGAHTTTAAVHSQYYFWLPNGRILRTRLNVSRSFVNKVAIDGVSVYGTGPGFRGHAWPGDSFTLYSAWEYSVTRNWVVALDLVYQHGANTHVSGIESIGGAPPLVVGENSGSRWQFAFAPAIEYNWNSKVGVIVGARWVPAGRNANATITPVAAINLVY